MPDSIIEPSTQRRALVLLAWLAAVTVALWLFPLFHLRPIRMNGDASKEFNTRSASFDAVGYAQRFWNDKLIPGSIRATNVDTLYDAMTRDIASAEQRYGRRSGIGGKSFFFFGGVGRVMSIERKGVWLALEGRTQPAILLIVGPVFGNAVRDSTGLADSEHLNSFDFNAFGSALNLLAESNVQPRLQSAKTGMKILFVGCAEVTAGSGPVALKTVPVSIDYIQ